MLITPWGITPDQLPAQSHTHGPTTPQSFQGFPAPHLGETLKSTRLLHRVSELCRKNIWHYSNLQDYTDPTWDKGLPAGKMRHFDLAGIFWGQAHTLREMASALTPLLAQLFAAWKNLYQPGRRWVYKMLCLHRSYKRRHCSLLEYSATQIPLLTTVGGLSRGTCQ